MRSVTIHPTTVFVARVHSKKGSTSKYYSRVLPYLCFLKIKKKTLYALIFIFTIFLIYQNFRVSIVIFLGKFYFASSNTKSTFDLYLKFQYTLFPELFTYYILVHLSTVFTNQPFFFLFSTLIPPTTATLINHWQIEKLLSIFRSWVVNFQLKCIERN